MRARLFSRGVCCGNPMVGNFVERSRYRGVYTIHIDICIYVYIGIYLYIHISEYREKQSQRNALRVVPRQLLDEDQAQVSQSNPLGKAAG